MSVTAAKNVLVVDDEPEVCHLTCRALQKAGMRCQKAHDGMQAVSMAQLQDYDAVLADLRMPNRNGFSLCQDLMQLPNPPKVLVMTGVRNDRITQDLLNRGVQRIFHKPVQYDSLAMEVASIVKDSGENKKLDKANIEQLHDIETNLAEVSMIYAEKLDPLFVDESDLPLPPRSTRNFINRLADNEGKLTQNLSNLSSEARKRGSQRTPCYCIATAVPTDQAWNQVGDPFKLTMRDLSLSGLRLMHTRAITSKYLAISWYATQLIAQQIRLPCKVIRCKPYLTLYDVGCCFAMAD